MGKKQLYTSKRGRKGEGRKSKIIHIQVPSEVKEMLDKFKVAYSLFFGQKVTYEQMLRDWMDHGRIDANVLRIVGAWKVVKEFPDCTV